MSRKELALSAPCRSHVIPHPLAFSLDSFRLRPEASVFAQKLPSRDKST